MRSQVLFWAAQVRVMILGCQIVRDTLCFIQMLSDMRALPCSGCVSQCVLGGFNHAYVMLDNHTCAATCLLDICRVNVDG